MLDQRGGQRDAAPLAAGQPGDVGVQPDGGEAEAGRAPRGPRRRRPTRARRRRRRRPSRTGRARPAGRRAGRRVAMRTPPVRVTRPVSGVSSPSISLQQRRLAAAVAADDADALAVGDAERDAVQHDGGAVGLADVLEVDQVAAIAAHQVTTVAPGAGPVAARAVAADPGGAQSRRRARSAAPASRHRKAQVGPEPDTSAGERAAPAPGVEGVAQVRRQRQRGAAAGRCRAGAAMRPTSPARSAASSALRSLDAAAGGRRRRAQPVELAVGVAGRDAVGRRARTPSAASPAQAPGSSTSPRPVPSAVPPSSGNATSLPSSGGERQRARSAPTSRSHSARAGQQGARRRRPSRRPCRRPPGSPCAGRGARRGAIAGRRRRAARAARQARLPPSAGSAGALAGDRSATARRRGRPTTSSTRSTAWKTVRVRGSRPGAASPTAECRLTLAGTRTRTADGGLGVRARPSSATRAAGCGTSATRGRQRAARAGKLAGCPGEGPPPRAAIRDRRGVVRRRASRVRGIARSSIRASTDVTSNVVTFRGVPLCPRSDCPPRRAPSSARAAPAAPAAPARSRPSSTATAPTRATSRCRPRVRDRDPQRRHQRAADPRHRGRRAARDPEVDPAPPDQGLLRARRPAGRAPGEKVTVDVPITIVGEVVPGGLLNQENTTVRSRPRPRNIPTEFEVSIEGLEIGTQITAGDVSCRPARRSITDAEILVLAISEAPDRRGPRGRGRRGRRGARHRRGRARDAAEGERPRPTRPSPADEQSE